MNMATGTGSIDRSARVRQIKRVIIALVLLAICVPTVLCIILFFKMGKMEKQIQELSLRKEKVTVVAENTVIKEAAASEAATGIVNTVTIVKNEDRQLNIVNDVVGANVQNVAMEDVSATIEQQQVVPVITEVPTKDTEEVLKPYSERRVYLTFDDGSSYNTAKILDILNEKGVKATFFVVGNENETSYEMCRRIVAEGHSIGMHSYSHVYKNIYSSEDAFENDLNMIQSYIYRTTGVLSDIYRFPGGSSNRVSKQPMSLFEQRLNDRGIVYYDWNVSSGDAESRTLKSKAEIIRNCIQGVENNNDSIILMHDLPEKRTTMEALPEIIDRLKEMGVQILPIDMTAPILHH